MLTLTPDELTAIKLSLRVAVVATAVSLPIGILVALALARGRFLGRGLLNALVLVPLVLPPVVTGYDAILLWYPKFCISSTPLRKCVAPGSSPRRESYQE